MPAKYSNDYETVLNKMKHDENMKNDESNDVGNKDVVLYQRDNGILTKEKRPIETRVLMMNLRENMMKCTNRWNISRFMTIMKPRDIYKAPWRVIPP